MGWWDWIGIAGFAIGVVAFLMAIPTLLHMKYSAPKIAIVFRIDDTADFHFLSCSVRNEPIVNGVLKALGVRREQVQDMVAYFEIREQGTGRVVCPLTRAEIKTQRNVLLQRISLPASLTPVSIAIVTFAISNTPNTPVYIYKEQHQILTLGAYTAKVELVLSDNLQSAEHDFVVQDKYPFAYWVNS